MAKKILSREEITAAAGYTKIPVPTMVGQVPDAATGFTEFQYSDKIIYIFDDFTGSFGLAQESGTLVYYTIKDTELPVQTLEWDIKSPPCWIYNTGSTQTITVTVILDR